MGKNNKKGPSEDSLLLPPHPAHTAAPIVDTHTHLLSTFAVYKQKYKDGRYQDVYDLVRGLYQGKKVAALVDVWCEAPVQKVWKEIADSAAVAVENRKEKWGELEYWFVMGVHPHEAKLYTDDVEKDILEAMAHPRNVGWGEIGLDYHYDNSPRDVQKEVFSRQLRHAVRLGKPITVHTREADEDTEQILKAEVPKDHKIHVHCFTDSPDFAQRLLNHFPNLYIGITGVITFSSNDNTSNITHQMFAQSSSPRIILETDAPYMIPANIYASLPAIKGRLPLCHTAMIPWTAEFVAGVAGAEWTVERVLELGRLNANTMYGV
ncbi:hypothetical protein B0F90DRAFT_1820437 [Multifurca ochricompacta]|uniref:Metallo-dependent hydrolase n=1 Tax=Multifurca ochricompacta TaxID=376703 RepID=A0AAD4LYN2_9AGAM|nr:hypothetical protein B0F90DRAFT_1820437 [Multifurca ochricompacta]